MPTIVIDGRQYEVAEGRNILQAALDNRLDLPYFCWHPAMGSVGACRLCAVKRYRDEGDKQGALAMGCMTPATEGTRVSIDDPEAAQFRRSVIEWLMINHPHDCPVCDEGGDCHLQDMTVMTGHSHRRYRGQKRTYRNQYLGPLLHHEMNRCIHCYRCVRFYCDHTGGDDLGVFGSRGRVYFGRVDDGVLESPFAGNLAEVCPTGVFTDKPYRHHYTRKWDLQSAPSICGHCGLGCNTLVGARYGSVRRVTSRYNGEVNGYWLCDRGRFGYEYTSAADRVMQPTQPWEEVVTAVTAAAAGNRLAAVGSPRAGLETNFAFRTLVGAERFCPGVAEAELELLRRFADSAERGAFYVPSLQQIEEADAVFVLGTDLTNEAPLLDLGLFRASREQHAGIFVAALRAGRVGGYARRTVVADAATAAGLAFDVAASIGAATTGTAAGSGASDIARALQAAERPLIITGTQHREPLLLEAAFAVVDALNGNRETRAWLTMATAEANSLGSTMLEHGDGMSLSSLIEAIERGNVTTLLVCENDLFERVGDHGRLIRALDRLEHLIVFDHTSTTTATRASHACPVATPAESNGTLINNEGRMQRFYQVLRSPEGIAPAWSVARDLLAVSPNGTAAAEWTHFDDITSALASAEPRLSAVVDVAPPAGFRHQHQPVPRMSQRYSGRNATIQRDGLDDFATRGRTPEPVEPATVRRPASSDPDTPFAFSMEGHPGRSPSTLLARVWAPGWNSNEAINQFQIEVGGALHGGDPGRRLFPSNGGAPSDAGAGAGGSSGSTSAGNPASSAAGRDDSDAHGDLFLICATAEIFGSESLSRRGPAIAQLAPPAYLLLHPDRATELGLEAGQTRGVTLVGDNLEISLDLAIDTDPRLPAHVAAIPAGYPETLWWQAPVRMRLRPRDEAGS